MDAPWPRHDEDPQTVRERRFLICLALSALLHGVVLLIKVQENIGDLVAQSRTGEQQQPLTVRLNHVSQPQAVAEAAPTPPKPAPTPPAPPRTRVLAVPTPQPQGPTVAATPPSAPSPPRNAPPPMDMMAMVNAARARRRAMDESAARENAAAAAGEREPSDSDRAAANLNRNLQTLNNYNPGMNGVFSILAMGTRTSQFAFRGWTEDERRSKREVYDVDAGNLGNIQLATVQRMIQLIRTHYSGDFNWESHRLGRVITMSARPADNAELEAFMMREFFESGR
jgi:outer membrane biosynthesis protein TonB